MPYAAEIFIRFSALILAEGHYKSSVTRIAAPS
jgi:hypothetical protein